MGVADYQLTANVWIRGILSDEYGVPVESVTYRTGGLHQAGRPEKLKVQLPPDMRVELARSLYDAFEQAKALCDQGAETGAQRTVRAGDTGVHRRLTDPDARISAW